jgi:hypothetical protein
MAFISIYRYYKLTMKHWDSEMERHIRIGRYRGSLLGGWEVSSWRESQNRVGDSKNVELATNDGV